MRQGKLLIKEEPGRAVNCTTCSFKIKWKGYMTMKRKIINLGILSTLLLQFLTPILVFATEESKDLENETSQIEESLFLETEETINSTEGIVDIEEEDESKETIDSTVYSEPEMTEEDLEVETEPQIQRSIVTNQYATLIEESEILNEDLETVIGSTKKYLWRIL